MNGKIIFISLILLLSCSNSLPHFTYDGIESFHEEDKISFTIYGSLSEEINPEKMHIKNYLIEDMGEFQCFLQKNEILDDIKRTHKIICSIYGTFVEKGYILEEPEVFGFDFKNELGQTTWPIEPERKTFLIGRIGQKIELDNGPILLGNLGDYINPLNSVRKNVIDKALNSLPSRRSVTKAQMIESMKKAKISYSLADGEIVYMIYKWETQNIEYDCYNLFKNPQQIDYSEDGTYSKGKGVCNGYSELFRTMCISLGIEAEKIIGYAKGVGYNPNVIPTDTNHAWNVVKLGSIYYLVDPTWGSGSCKNENFFSDPSDFYFCTNPEILIRSHLPADSRWQFVSPTITLQQFVNKLELKKYFYQNGFKTISPDLPKFNTDGTITIIITYEPSSQQKTILIQLSHLESSSYVEQPNSCFVKKQTEYAKLTCYANKRGQYRLVIFGGPAGLQSYPHLVEYTITSSKDNPNPKGFPNAYGLFEESDLEIEPFYNPLTRGNLINFRIKTTTFDNLYIINNIDSNSQFREFDNNGNGVFTADSVYIFGKAVYLATKIDGNFNYFVLYNTIPDPNSSTDATFPYSYFGPKNVLYSPLIDTLKIGNFYQFKIKCESATKIAVKIGDKYNYLNKGGDIFTGNVKISGDENKEVYIVYINDGNIQSLYVYKTSK